MTLSLHHVTVTFPDGEDRIVALDDVSLDIGPGDMTVVLGPSGAGKSTLLAVSATLVRPDRGSVVVDGTSTAGLTRSALATLRRESVGLVFQQPNLLPALTVVEQIEVMSRLGSGTGRHLRARSLDALDAVGMADHAHRRPGQLSGGQRQRVNLARALVNDPALLLVDEPTAALDRERGHAVMELVRTVTRQRGVGTLLVTHDVELVDPSSDRVVQCRDGRLSPGGRAATPSLT